MHGNTILENEVGDLFLGIGGRAHLLAYDALRTNWCTVRVPKLDIKDSSRFASNLRYIIVVYN
jgi:hypothetical protein